MSEWINRVKNHALLLSLQEIEQSVNRARDIESSDQNSIDSLNRISRIVGYGKTYLDQIDADLTPLSVLDEANNSVNPAKNETNAFADNRNAQHLVNANSYLDTFLRILGSIPLLDVRTSIKEVNEAFNRQKQSLSGQVSGLIKDLNSLTAEKHALSEKLVTLANEISQNKQRADAVITEFQNQFSTAQETRHAEFATFTKDKTTDWNAFINTTDQEQNGVMAELERRVDSLIAEIDTQKKHAQKVVGVISTESVTHGYRKTADEERTAAKYWSWLAGSALSIWIVAGMVFFFFTYDKELSWTALARQFLISTPFILLAGFSALQVSKHQKVERISRQLELELAAIDPYLATFDINDKNQIKRELVEKMFGQRDAEPIKTEIKQTTETLSDLVKSLNEIKDAVLKK
jgi:hypothetical protein